MIKYVSTVAPLLALVATLSGCEAQPAPAPDCPPVKSPEAAPTAEAKSAPAELPKPLVETILTAEEQKKLTPDEVIKQFKLGNARFVAGELTVRDHTKQVRAAASGQFPKAAILSCIDSRVPVEDVFDRGIGDVFVARVAGNFENVDLLGSMEFATKVAGAKVILVLGHEHCGAVKGAIDGVELGNITAMLANIQPAIAAFSSYKGEKTSKNPEFVHLVAEENVRITIDDIVKNSPVISEMISAGEVKIMGAMYDMDTGAVVFVEPHSAAADKKPAATDKKPAATDKKPAAADKKPAAADKKPAAK